MDKMNCIVISNRYYGSLVCGIDYLTYIKQLTIVLFLVLIPSVVMKQL